MGARWKLETTETPEVRKRGRQEKQELSCTKRKKVTINSDYENQESDRFTEQVKKESEGCSAMNNTETLANENRTTEKITKRKKPTSKVRIRVKVNDCLQAMVMEAALGLAVAGFLEILSVDAVKEPLRAETKMEQNRILLSGRWVLTLRLKRSKLFKAYVLTKQDALSNRPIERIPTKSLCTSISILAMASDSLCFQVMRNLYKHMSLEAFSTTDSALNLEEGKGLEAESSVEGKDETPQHIDLHLKPPSIQFLYAQVKKLSDARFLDAVSVRKEGNHQGRLWMNLFEDQFGTESSVKLESLDLMPKFSRCSSDQRMFLLTV